MTEQLEGIDVSYAQPPADWARVRAAGIAFAYIRQGYRLRTDTKWRVHAVAAAAAGMPCGAYHFAYVDHDPYDEVSRFIDDGAVDAPGLTLRPALDIETSNNAPASLTEYWARTWIEEVEKRCGVTPLLYTYPSFWLGLGPLARVPFWREVPLWVAHYGVTKPNIPAPWAEYAIWQWSGSGQVDGVEGKVDRSVLADGGDLEWLQWRYARVGTSLQPMA